MDHEMDQRAETRDTDVFLGAEQLLLMTFLATTNHFCENRRFWRFFMEKFRVMDIISFALHFSVKCHF